MVYAIADILNYWNAIGVFSYVLPFLLIFAIVFAILKKTEMLGKENKAVNTIVAATVGLLALQFDIVPIFFENIFPKLGIFLAVILSILLLMGFTGVNESSAKWVKWIGVVGAIIVVLWAFSDFAYFGPWGYGGYWWFFYSEFFWSLIVLGVVVGAIYWVGRQG